MPLPNIDREPTLPKKAGTYNYRDVLDDSMLTENFKRGNYDEYGGPDGRIDREHARQIAGVRKRHPMLTALLLNGPASQHANLSSPEDTDKFARLADAYNASYRMTGGNFQGGGFNSIGSRTPLEYTAVTPLSTQDQKQMDQRRSDEGLLHNYLQGEESWFQRQVWDQKMKEQWAYMTQEQKELFFAKNEEMRRAAELFDSFSRMNEQEYLEYMKAIGIPYDQMREINSLMSSGRFWEAATLMERFGFTPQTAEQVIMMKAQSEAIQKANAGDYRGAMIAASKINADMLLSKVTQLIEEAKAGGAGITNDTLAQLVSAAEDLAKGGSEVASWVGQNPWASIIVSYLAAIVFNGGSAALSNLGKTRTP